MADTCKGDIMVPLSTNPNVHQEFLTVKSTWFPFNRVTPLICSWNVRVCLILFQFFIHFGPINLRVTGEWQLPPWCNHYDNRRTQSAGRWWGLFKRLLSCSSLHERIQVSAVKMFELFYNFVIYFEFVVEFAVVSTLFRHSSGMSTTHIRKMSVLSWSMSDSTMVTPKDYLSLYLVSMVESL